MVGATELTLLGTVVADVNGYGTAPEIAGANVTAFGTSCSTSPPLPNTCPVESWTTTSGTGEFGMVLATGDYYIAVHPDTTLSGGAYPYGFGGASQAVNLTGSADIELTVYPLAPYGNATLVLPGYACDDAYLNDVGEGGPGCQNPVLSWTQDGAYYLNTTNELVFYSFVNRTVYPIAAWTPLYQGFPAYPMIPNALFITQDGSYLYDWGTLTPKGTSITAEAVNVTTHRVWLYTFAGVTVSAVVSNGQVQLTGWDGNDSDLTIILGNGSLYEHDLWSTGQSVVAKLDFFEANNAYWEPYLNGYVDVQADGSSSDQVEEWQLRGPTSYTLTRTFEGGWGAGRVINGVNGIALNLTDRTLSFGLGGTNNANTVVARLNGSGTITGFAAVEEGSSNLHALGPGAASDRPSLLVTGPALQEVYDGFYNSSWLAELTPGHLGFETTNLSGAYEYGGSPPGYSWSQWAQEGQFYNASYLIAPNSYTCNREFVDACTINGTGGVAVGTVWWYWQWGNPKFPFPASAPAAEPNSVPPTSVTLANVTSSSVALSWTVTGENGSLYYSVDWGTSPAEGDITWLPGNVHSYTLTGLPTGTRVYVSVAGWNLHYGTPGGTPSILVTGGPAPPTALSASASTNSSLHWSWTQSSSPGIVNNTLYLFTGGDCSGVPEVDSTGGPATSATLGGLSPGSLYSAFVTAWNASGESSPSDCASGSTSFGGEKVTFNESGLPTDDAWSVNITGVALLTSSGAVPSIATQLANGTYNLSVGTNDTTFAPSFPHRLTVNGTPVTVAIRFSPYLYAVSFAENGLPPATNWGVTVGRDTRVSNASQLEFNETNGTYAYTVSGVPGWHQSTIPYAGALAVSGAARFESLNFSRMTYAVTFSETGLPAGTEWTVSVNLTPYSSNDSEVVVNLPNGSCPFRVGGITGYRSSPINGTLSVNGTDLTEPVSFTKLPFLTPTELLAVAGASIAAVLAAVVVFVRHRRRRSPAGPTEVPPEKAP